MNAPESSPAADRIRRWRAVHLTFGASIAAKVASILCTFAQVPLAVGYLGQEAYGFWMALLGIALLMNLVDFGIGVGDFQAGNRVGPGRHGEGPQVL